MKTPREILLVRHEAIEPKLNDIRQSVVAKSSNKDGARRTAQKAKSFSDSLVSFCVGCPKAIWLELIWPSRRIWAGLAAVWILILAANFSMRDHTESKMAKLSPPSPDVIMAFRQEQQLMNELIGPNDPPVAEPQKPYSPRPSGERRTELLMT